MRDSIHDLHLINGTTQVYWRRPRLQPCVTPSCSIPLPRHLQSRTRHISLTSLLSSFPSSRFPAASPSFPQSSTCGFPPLPSPPLPAPLLSSPPLLPAATPRVAQDPISPQPPAARSSIHLRGTKTVLSTCVSAPNARNWRGRTTETARNLCVSIHASHSSPGAAAPCTAGTALVLGICVGGSGRWMDATVSCREQGAGSWGRRRQDVLVRTMYNMHTLFGSQKTTNVRHGTLHIIIITREP